ncbi:hypothetical protein FB45DRAFT_1007899 [Roridomyces roridus]|uniref:Uncharacterized protein n=1 Tax=Roridomyces roridus TaxID=1738132 RepID=A0AAD7BDF5_9AGAR|nr:hypothetical protein FB45DRAFT_1007899 [Roridomyces roridus]
MSATHYISPPTTHYPSTKMTTLIQIHTFLQKYFGDALSRFFRLFVRKAGSEAAEDVQTKGPTNGTSPGPNSAIVAPDGDDRDVVPHVESVAADTSAEFIKPSGSELLSAVVIETIALPSLPSILTKPEARPPLPVENVFEVQDFGRPSNVFHERRTALGCITNIPVENIKAGTTKAAKRKSKTKVTKEAKPAVVNYSLPTRFRKAKKRSRSRSRTVLNPAAAAVSEVLVTPAPGVDTTTPTPAPCSPGWNKAKDDIIAEMRGFNKQVLASRRHSMPVLAATLSPDVVAVKTTKRHSAPPVLVVSSEAPKELLSGLMHEAAETLTVLDEANTQVKPDTIKARPFSAIAPEPEEDIFVVGEDTDDEDEYYFGAGLPTVSAAHDTPTKTKTRSGFGKCNFKLVSSISASRSMAELANASSRSISELLNVWDGLMKSPKLARVLSRWDGVTRRNDSIV